MKRNQCGVTLIELMISLLLSALLMLALVQTFQANKGSDNLQVSFARIQETGRIAIELMSRDIRMADYWGCQSGTANINDLLDHTDSDYAAAAADLDWLSSDAVQIGNDVAAGTTVGTLNVLAGTDTLTVITSADACNATGRMSSMQAANLKASKSCEDSLKIGQVVVVTNCSSGEMFSLSGFGGCGSDKCVVGHNQGNIANPDPGVSPVINNRLHTFSSTYGSDARLLVPIKKTYFIAEDTNGIPSLYLKQDTAAAVQMVVGIEDMQLIVGEDTDDDGQVNILSAPTVGVDMDNVLTIKIQLQVRGEQYVNSSDADGLLRKSFSATSTIRNRVI